MSYSDWNQTVYEGEMERLYWSRMVDEALDAQDHDVDWTRRAPAPRVRGTEALMSKADITDCWRLYQGGQTVIEIVAPRWREWGYASPNSATQCLYSAWRVRGCKLRGRGVAA